MVHTVDMACIIMYCQDTINCFTSKRIRPCTSSEENMFTYKISGSLVFQKNQQQQMKKNTANLRKTCLSAFRTSCGKFWAYYYFFHMFSTLMSSEVRTEISLGMV